MSSPYQIRPAGFHDVEAIFALIKSFPDELVPRSLPDLVQNVDRFVVAESGGAVIGTAAWGILPEIGKARQPTVEIKSVAVRRDFQGQGVGRALVQKVIERVRLLKPAQILVLTFRPEFFAKLGFVKVPKETLMHKLYIGCLNCTKYDSPFTCPEVAMVLQEAPPSTP